MNEPREKNSSQFARPVWVAAISLKGLWPEETTERRMKAVIKRMENVFSLEPDIICLPETVNISWVNQHKALPEIAEDEVLYGPVATMLAEIARKQHCYITCPIITKKEGRYFNSSILLDREGKTAGIFHKIHPTSTEMLPNTYYKEGSITPGSLKAKSYSVDFGSVGLQICADADWADGWQSLQKEGSDIVCFSSQGPYSNVLRNRAWMHQYYIVSATGEDAQIVDISGDVIQADGENARYVCAPVNLEKKLLHLQPHREQLAAIQKEYGRSIRIKMFHAENWATLESLEPGLTVQNILNKYQIPTYAAQQSEATDIQIKHRL